MSIIYKTTDEKVNFNDVKNILEMAFGGRKIDNVDEIKEAFINSQYKIYAFDDDKLIGFSRAIANSNYAIIYNVALNPLYQGKGIGKDIINRLVASLEGKEIYTFTHPRTISLYEHLGFVRTKMAFKYIKEADRERVKNQAGVGFFLPDDYLFDGEKRNDIKPIINDNIVYKDHFDDNDIKDINKLLNDYYSDNKSIKDTEKDLKRADFIELAYENNILIGVAEIITDSVKEALLVNAAVKKDYEGVFYNLINKITLRANEYDIFIHANLSDYSFYNNSRDFKRYKTAFKYVGNTFYNERLYLPRDYRYDDELGSEVIRYYKGKILN